MIGKRIGRSRGRLAEQLILKFKDEKRELLLVPLGGLPCLSSIFVDPNVNTEQRSRLYNSRSVALTTSPLPFNFTSADATFPPALW